jgi:hypothetical protein
LVGHPFHPAQAEGPEAAAGNPFVDLKLQLLGCWQFDSEAGFGLLDSAGAHRARRMGGELTLGRHGNAWWHISHRADPKKPPGYCDLGTGDGLNIKANEDFTWAGWIFPRAKQGTMLALQNRQSSARLLLQLDGQAPVLTVLDDRSAGAPCVVQSARAFDVQWHHVAVCRRGDRLQIYCDGDRTADASARKATGAITTEVRSLGLDQSPQEQDSPEQAYAQRIWNGALDEWCYYGRALAAEEIERLAAGELTKWVREQDAPLAISAAVDRPSPKLSTWVAPSAADTKAAAAPPLKIPDRDPEAGARLLDLSLHYNAALVGTWHPATNLSGERANDLVKLPAGVQKLGGVKFDVRGLIQLTHANQQYWQGKFSTAVRGIPVKQKCEKLHFLQGCGFTARDGEEIGGYDVIYSDGAKEYCPIVYGEDVRDWWAFQQEPLLADRGEVAWTGTNAAAAGARATLRLYRMTWNNPHPDKEITQLHFRSLSRGAAPFVIAITAE